MAVLQLSVDIDAPPETVWGAVTDWPRQGDWMMLTRVRGTALGGVGVGGGVEAFTGIARLGFLDTMEITEWEPPHRCLVRHTGSVVRGTGAFEVWPLPGGRARLYWSEDLDLPLGTLGRGGWVLVQPVFARFVRRSLQRLATQVESEARRSRRHSDRA